MKLKGVLLVLVAAAVWPAAGNASPLHGTVVARSHGTLLVATPSGVVRSMHGSAAVGARLNGSRVVGRSARARIHGVVVKRIGATTFLSSNRHLIAVRDRTPSAPGTVVNTTVGIRPNGELEAEDEDDVGQVAGAIQVQATVTAVGSGTVTLSVNGQAVTLDLPNGLTLPAGVVGQTVSLIVSVGGGDDDQGDDHGDDHGGHHDGGGDG